MAKKKKAKKPAKQKSVETITHPSAKRRNLPSAEHEAVMSAADRSPVRVAIERRNSDLDPQLVWRGKFGPEGADQQTSDHDWSDLVVSAPPLYIQERVHPKALVDDLVRETADRRKAQEKAIERAGGGEQLDLFADFNGVPDEARGAEFYQHDANWTNRLILGDSLQVMASLAEREGLRGQVQCIYLDPPYGIKFNSNFQWSTTSRDVKDGKADHITREPEQVKAFRDTWRDGIHSYLTYLRDRLTVARDLLHPTGSVFAQIGEENVHLLRAAMDEVFGSQNCCAFISFKKTSGAGSFAGGTNLLASVYDYVLWYGRDKEQTKYRQLHHAKELAGTGGGQYTRILASDGTVRRVTDREQIKGVADGRVFRGDNLTSQTTRVGQTTVFPVAVKGATFRPSKGGWKTNAVGMERLKKADRLYPQGRTLSYRRFFDDFAAFPVVNGWDDTITSGFADAKTYVVQTNVRVVERCLLMATDPGDLVLDPTCGSGTTAYVAEQWGRRWITIDTSRVSLALARARIMGARYPYYVLADSPEGQQKEAELSRTEKSTAATYGRVRQGFVYERVPHITLKSIANNAEIDTIWEQYQGELEPLRERLNNTLGKNWEEWEIPREAEEGWSDKAKQLHAAWWEKRIARQREIDASIAAKADHEYLYDKPHQDKSKVRVAGPFTVESLSPHRTLAVGADDQLIDPLDKKGEPATSAGGGAPDFASVILENLRTAGVQQAHKEDRIEFSSLKPWPGVHVAAEGRYQVGESGPEKRAAVFIGPEFGTVARSDLAAAAREAAEAGFDVLVACAFSYEAHASEFNKLGALPVLKARMNADLHMAGDLANTGKGNLFVIFGEPDIEFYAGGTEKLGAELVRRSDRAEELESKGKLSADEREELERFRTFEERASQTAEGQLFVEVRGVDVFDPATGQVRSDSADGIACWMIDDDYNEESFFVRHAYFLGQNDPYKALKTTLKAEIDEEAWSALNSDTSRPFDRPTSGRIAVKVINHLGDEVMKVFRVE
ncbi:site-specific DNA-methyltransferase [Botrimarina sp.]|uniref:site-specific DNA-methyltransferase n=1 Tax=Botrimarina sp. TaxID=2795802 RepID=UPI0032EFFD19